jgi:hypothetical protein
MVLSYLCKFAEADVLHTLSRPFVGKMHTFKDQIYQARVPVLHLIILLVLFCGEKIHRAMATNLVPLCKHACI